jgi:hypothetical protein
VLKPSPKPTDTPEVKTESEHEDDVTTEEEGEDDLADGSSTATDSLQQLQSYRSKRVFKRGLSTLLANLPPIDPPVTATLIDNENNDTDETDVESQSTATASSAVVVEPAPHADDTSKTSAIPATAPRKVSS